MLSKFLGDIFSLTSFALNLLPILRYSLSNMTAALHSCSVSLNISVMLILVLIVAELSSGMRFPRGLKRISFVVGSMVDDV